VLGRSILRLRRLSLIRQWRGGGFRRVESGSELGVGWRGAARWVSWSTRWAGSALCWLAFLTTKVGVVAGLVMLVGGPVVWIWLLVGPGGSRIGPGVSGVLLNQETAVRGHYLYARYGDDPVVMDLHSGTVGLLPPGWRRGRARILTQVRPEAGRAVPRLLLSDPLNGRLRDPGDLEVLAAALTTSAHESDREVGRQVRALATQSRRQVATDDEPRLLWEPLEVPSTLGLSLRALAHAAGFLAVPVSLTLTLGGIEVERDQHRLTIASDLAQWALAIPAMVLGLGGGIWVIWRIGHLLHTIGCLLLGRPTPMIQP
jgi:hypothetical protein